MPLPVPVELDSGAATTGGVLTVARALPEGWTRGISFADNHCLGPVVMGECPASTVVVTPGVDEVQTFSLTSGGGDGTPPTGGTFTLTFAGGTTAPIAYNADAATIDAAIEAVLGAGSVTVAGSLPGPVTITYTGDEGDQQQPQVTGDGSALTGAGAPYTVTGTTVTEGAPAVTAPTNFKPTQSLDGATFRPVSLIQAIACSTLGGFDVEIASEAALDQTREYALARELLTGEASARDANQNTADPEGNPALVSSATDLGADFVSVTAQVACLEQNLADATFGRGGFLLVSPGWASFALAERVIWRDGARWRTAWGTTVVISAGFDGRAPVADGPGVPPAADAPLYAYAVANLWAATGQRATYSDVNRSVNTAASRTEDLALAAFPPCAVFAAASTVATAC